MAPVEHRQFIGVSFEHQLAIIGRLWLGEKSFEQLARFGAEIIGSHAGCSLVVYADTTVNAGNELHAKATVTG